MPAGLRASIVVIGDEILGGYVQDTNSGWLAGRLREHGVPLDRVVTVPDSRDAIAEALRSELTRARPRVVLTSGGIGSTPDDLTLEAVAEHLGMGLRADPDLDDRISQALRWTAERGMAVEEAHVRSMRKMARIPETAWLVPGSGGFLPGVAVDVDGGCGLDGGATIVVLPGVPGELRRIVRDGVEPTLLSGRGHPQHVAEVTHGYPESTLNPVLDRVVAEFPDVAIGSYPGRECIIRLRGDEDQVAAAMALVTDYLQALERRPGADRVRASWQARWS